MTRDEARAWYVNVLLDKVREDKYPSATHMSMIEAALERMPQLIPDYMDVLLDKVADERFPSIPMLQRIQGVAEMLPRYDERTLRELQQQSEA
jgi:hypothetical protein